MNVDHSVLWVREVMVSTISGIGSVLLERGHATICGLSSFLIVLRQRLVALKIQLLYHLLL